VTDHDDTFQMKFDYGQEVLYKRPFETGIVVTRCFIVGITLVETAEQSELFGHPQGTVMYTIEFEDGTDKFVSEDELGLG
jgi:hypothetical protein